MEPIRVLQVFHGMNCGGAENMIMNLYRAIDRTRVQFDFLVHTERKCFFDEEIEKLGGRIFRVPYFNGKNYVKYKSALNEFFKTHKEFKIIHGHLGSCASIYLNVAKKFGLKTIAHSHGSSSGRILYRVFSYPTRYIADFLFGCAQRAGRDRYGARIWEKKNGVVLNNSIDVDKYVYNPEVGERKRKELGLEGRVVFGHIGRFNTPKNHMYLLDIFAGVYEKDPNSRLLLIGDGFLRGKIEKKIKKLHIEDAVVMTGVRSDANELLSAMDCFLFPSLYEGLPVTLVEAQTAGLLCLVSDRVTPEVCFTDRVQMISIDNGTAPWIQAITSIDEFDKKDTRQDIINAGYDIKTSAKWLEDFYCREAE